MSTYGQIGSVVMLGLAAGGFYYGMSDGDRARRNSDWRETYVVNELEGDRPDYGPGPERCEHCRPGEEYYTSQQDDRRPPGPPPPRDERGGPAGDDRGRNAGPPPPPPPPKPPIERVLDADQDGTISADEMEKAGERLKKLDLNEDGKLTHDEYAPPPPPPGPPGFGPGGFGPPGDRPPPREDGPPPRREDGPPAPRRGEGPPPRRDDRPRPPREETSSFPSDQTAGAW